MFLSKSGLQQTAAKDTAEDTCRKACLRNRLTLSTERQHLTPYPPTFLCADQRGKSKKTLNTFKLRKWYYENKTNSNYRSNPTLRLKICQETVHITYF